MKHLEEIIMLPFAIVGLLSLMAVDLVRVARGERTVDEEWHNDYVNSNLNHGQGRKDDGGGQSRRM